MAGRRLLTYGREYPPADGGGDLLLANSLSVARGLGPVRAAIPCNALRTRTDSHGE